MAQPRFYAALVAGFATTASILACTGIYGVLSYAVARRRREFGVRLAMGAGRADILRLVLGQGMAAVAAGLGLGLAASAAAARLLRGLLFGVTPGDPTV